MADVPDWFKALPRKSQQMYFKEHPDSQITKQFNTETQKSDTEQPSSPDVLESHQEIGFNTAEQQKSVHTLIKDNPTLQKTLQEESPARLQFGNQLENTYRQPIKDVYQSLDSQNKQHLAAITEKLKQGRNLDKRDQHAFLDFSSTVQKYYDSHQGHFPEQPSLVSTVASAGAGLGARMAAVHMGLSMTGVAGLAIGAGLAAGIVSRKLVKMHRAHQKTKQIQDATKGILQKNEHLSSLLIYCQDANDSSIVQTLLAVLKNKIQKDKFSSKDWSHVLQMKGG